MTTIRVHPLLESAFRAMGESGIRWCLLRGQGELAAPAGDVDLLVDRADLRDLDRVLALHGFRRRSAHGRGTHTFFLTYDRLSGSWLKLDVVTELSFGVGLAVRTGAAEEMLARRRASGVLFVAAPDDEFWALLLHCLLDKRDIPAHHTARLNELARQARTEGSMPAALSEACHPEWSAESLRKLAEAGEWKGLRAAAPAICARWFGRLRAGTRLKARVVDRLKDTRLFHSLGNRGIAIALLGPDGAGKSTLAENLERSSPLAVKRLYMGLWGGEFVGSRVSSVKGLGWFVRHAKLLSRGLTGLTYRRLGYLVVYDRHTIDRQPSSGKRSWGGRVSDWLAACACFAPDLVFVLDVPGSVMFARKGEHRPEQLDRQRERLRLLARQLRNAVSIDASHSAEAVRQEVTRHIWHHMAAGG